MRHIVTAFLLIALLAVPWLMLHPEQARVVYSIIDTAEKHIAAVILTHSPKSVVEIKSKYLAATNKKKTESKVRVLIVPGHEPNYGGAEYSNIFERDMVVDLANQLREFIDSNDRYEVFVTRDKNSWTPTFQNYFDSNWEEIKAWIKGHREETSRLSRLGEYHPVVPSVLHNVAPANIAYRLYGISKWSNENDIDIIIHVHFNDHPGHSMSSPGLYNGFAIYVPENQYFNSSSTQTLANSIFNRLQKFNAVSNFSGESGGIVQTQDLIAVGAYNSIDAASMLIEYGYIYEPQFNNPEIYDMAIKDLAFQTYLGLQDFFDDKHPANISGSLDTLVMPYVWTTPIVDGKANPKDIFSLQTAMVMDGVYPPTSRTLNDCPRTGNYGNCTKTAVELFQKKRGITGEYGMVGNKTINELNRLFSITTI
jgi:N-acetylmuramoyl-L-alanine amidase